MKEFYKNLFMCVCLYFGDCFANTTFRDKFPIRSDYKYDEQVAGWVKWHPVPATWHEARLRCYYEGAVLASPINQKLKNTMARLLDENSVVKYLNMYTGIHATFSKGDYTSVEGVPLHKMDVKWSPYDSSKGCVSFSIQGNIQSTDCSADLPYMCYKRGPKDLPVTICGTDDQEYDCYAETGSCYKFHRIGSTWSRAHMICLAEGGHLAIINSDLEAEVIKALYAKYPDASIMAAYPHTASIGFQDWGERGSWWTVQGQDLAEAGYDKWDQGSPDGKKTQFCGAVVRSAKLNDIWCDGEFYTFPFICEIDPVENESVL